MRIPLATDYKTRTANPDKDARQKNSYIEVKNEQPIVRKRPSAQGGVAVGSGVAQGGYGLVLFYGDVAYPITEATGTNWDSGTAYVVGDHAAVGFVDYWALADNTNSQPPSSNWSRSKVSPIGSLTSWTVGTIPMTSSTTNNGLSYNGSIYIYLVTDGTTGEFYSITSANGINWVSHSITGMVLQNNNNVVYGNGIFLCAGGISGGIGETATSTDGINWTPHTNTLTFDFYDFGFNGSIFCGVLTDGKIYTSSDGYNWTYRGAMTASGVYAITANGSSFVITSLGVECAYSTDGISWNLSSMPSSTTWQAVRSNGSVFCAVSTDGKYAVSSTGGSTWSEGLTGLSASSGISYGSGLFLCTKGNTNGIDYATSANGINWTIRQFPVAGVTGQWSNSIYGDKFVVISRSIYCATSLTGL